MQDKAIYSKPVDELLAQKAKFMGRPVRAEGQPRPRIAREARSAVRVPLHDARRTTPSCPCASRSASCPTRSATCPDIDVGVTVEGELKADNTFEASSVLAKCPSKYEMQQKKQQGEQMPHGPLAAGP